MNVNKDRDSSSISKTSDYESIGEYWDTHSLDDHWEETQEVEFQVRAMRMSFFTEFKSFKATGFCVLENVVSHAECERLIKIIDGDARRAGIRNLVNNPGVFRLARGRRLLRIARSAAGRKVYPYKATLFQKSGKANWLVAWHQDTALPIDEMPNMPGWTAASMKDGVLFAQAPANVLERIVALRIHLDPSTNENGPLRVIPGSHQFGILNDEQARQFQKAGDVVDCLVGKGGVIVMRPLLLHASSKTIRDLPRRVLHIEYCDHTTFQEFSLATA